MSSHIKRYLSLPDFLNWPLQGKIFTREWVVLSGPGSRLTQELSSEGVRGTRFHAGMYSGASAGGARWPWLRRAQGRGGWDHIGDDCRAPQQRAAKSVYVLGGGAQRKWVVWGSFTVSAAGVPPASLYPVAGTHVQGNLRGAELCWSVGWRATGETLPTFFT